MHFHGKGTIERANKGLEMLVDAISGATEEDKRKWKKVMERYERIEKYKESKLKEKK